MNEKSLNKVKILVILLKAILISYFVFSIYNNRKDVIAGFNEGWKQASHDSTERSEAQHFDYVSVVRLQDTSIDAGKYAKIKGVSQFVIQKSNDTSISIYEVLLWIDVFATGIFGLALIIQVFKLLNKLQKLQVFDKGNIVILKNVIKVLLSFGIGYNIFLIGESFVQTQNVFIKGYQLKPFSISDLQLDFIFITILLYLVSIIWDYAIDVKSENELTV